jgi:hypothetical protein
MPKIDAYEKEVLAAFDKGRLDSRLLVLRRSKTGG